jgi:outer membrane protein assembly factor BamA
MAVSRTDIGNILASPDSRAFLYPSLIYTKDTSTHGFISPIRGYRYAVSLSGAPIGFEKDPVQFGTILGDARWYYSLGRSGRYTFAVRASGAASFGRSPQLFYTAGVENWINRYFDQIYGFPIREVQDFVFATPVMPLRGSDLNSQNGPYFGLINAEFRFPLIAALLPGPLPIFPLYNMQGVAFFDAGSVWGGDRVLGLDYNGNDIVEANDFNLWTLRDAETGKRYFDDLIVAGGFGLRTILLGYPVKLDFAWPFDGHKFGERRTYFSIGFDF